LIDFLQKFLYVQAEIMPVLRQTFLCMLLVMSQVVTLFAAEDPAGAAQPLITTDSPPATVSAGEIQPRLTEPGREEKPAASTNRPAVVAASSYQVPPNTILESLIPLAASARISVLNSKNPMVFTVREAVAVPFGFSPANINKILLISGTSDGEGSSIRAMRSFTNMALRLGWVVIAADGPNGKPPQDNPPWRWAMISTVLEHLHTVWPDSRKWPIACAGFSGGAKWSAIMAAILSQRGYNLAGVFMGGCNEDMASEAVRLYWPATKFKKTPMFLSSGSDDAIATPSQHVAVQESMLDTGFNRVRLEHYKGSHELDPQALRTALYWFFEDIADASPAPAKSSEPFREPAGSSPPLSDIPPASSPAPK
jgi:hypothetical protein